MCVTSPVEAGLFLAEAAQRRTVLGVELRVPAAVLLDEVILAPPGEDGLPRVLLIVPHHHVPLDLKHTMIGCESQGAEPLRIKEIPCTCGFGDWLCEARYGANRDHRNCFNQLVW